MSNKVYRFFGGPWDGESRAVYGAPPAIKAPQLLPDEAGQVFDLRTMPKEEVVRVTEGVYDLRQRGPEEWVYVWRG